MLQESTVGWTQLKTLYISATNPAVPITIPGLSSYRKYVLVVSPAIGVRLVNAGQIQSTLVTSTAAKVFGIYDSSVRLEAYAAVPTAVVITPFANLHGEISDLPVGYPETSVVISGQNKLNQFISGVGQTIFTLTHTPTSPGDVLCFINGGGQTNGTDYTIAGNTGTWLNTDFSLDAGDKVQFYYQI